MANWALPGLSSVGARILQHQDNVEHCWIWKSTSKRWPVSVEIHPTNRCNLRCLFCSFRNTRHGEVLSSKAFSRLIDSLLKCRPILKSVVFSGGGEPSIHPFLPEAVNRLSSGGIDVGIISNGVHMNKQLFHAYLRCTWIRFSLTVPLQMVYSRMISPHKQYNFHRVIGNMRCLAEAKNYSHDSFPTLGIGYIVTKSSQSDEALLECLEVGAQAGADYIMYRPLVGFDSEQMTRPLSEIEGVSQRIGERAKELGIVAQFDHFLRRFNGTVQQQVESSSPVCPIVQDGLIGFVAATGDVFPCYSIYQHRVSSEWCFGNIKNDDLREIWRSRTRELVIRRIDARTCPYCRYQEHNKVLQLMAEGGPSPDCRELEDRHWKFL